MKMKSTNITGVVVECYHHDSQHRVMVIRQRDAKIHHFFFVSNTPLIDFGDPIQMNYQTEKFFIRKGNSCLTYRIIPLIFPDTLLLELLLEYINI